MASCCGDCWRQPHRASESTATAATMPGAARADRAHLPRSTRRVSLAAGGGASPYPIALAVLKLTHRVAIDVAHLDCGEDELGMRPTPYWPLFEARFEALYEVVAVTVAAFDQAWAAGHSKLTDFGKVEEATLRKVRGWLESGAVTSVEQLYGAAEHEGLFVR